MMPILNSSLSKDDLDYLFDRIDLDNSGSISIDEFRENIEGKDVLKGKQELENTMH